MNPWQPIETAPKDGTRVDLWCEFPPFSDGEVMVHHAHRFADCQWRSRSACPRWVQDGDTVEDHGWAATHWMPVQESPGEWSDASNIRATTSGGNTFTGEQTGVPQENLDG